MDPESGPLRTLGAAIGREHDAAVGRRAAKEHDAERARLLAAARRREKGTGHGRWIAVAAAAAAAIGLGVIWAAWPEAGRTGDAGASSPDGGRWLAAPVDAAMPVVLRDGTQLTLAPRSRVRVDDVAAQDVRIVLESGELHARMAARSGARWRVAAGPFEVTVTGTEFTVSWNADEQRFELGLLEGVVDVRGPLLAEGRKVRAGETLRVEGRSRLEVTKGGSPPPIAREAPSTMVPPPRPPAPLAPPAPAGPVALAPPVLPAPALSSPPAPQLPPLVAGADWETLAGQRRHAEAVAAARIQGLDALCTNLPMASLVRLADAARYATDVDAATLVLQCIRSRFPGTTAAAEAAFHYGRLVSDVRGNALAAAAWFETYLAEAPDGPFAREASGRLVEAYDRLGNAAAAQRAARRYLARFPDGPHAALARRLAGR